MTVHDSYTHECPRCAAYYIPFDQDVPCPRCGVVEEERYDFIPTAVGSVKWNIEIDGSYVPGAWFVGGLGDHLLLIVFTIFERWNKQQERGFPAAVEEELSSRGDWGDQTYLKPHIALLARRIHDEIQSKADQPMIRQKPDETAPPDFPG